MTSDDLATIEAWLDRIASGVIRLDDDNAGLAAATLEWLRSGGAPEQPLPEDHLSPNFTLEELTHSDTAIACGIDNTPDDAAVEQLELLASITLEGIRAICGDHTLVVSSGFRCAALNSEVGGASNSAHLYGCAADFTIPDFGPPIDVCRAIEPHLIDLGIDQLIHENDSWVHVGRAIPPSTEPRHQCLTIDHGNTIQGIV